MFNFVFDKRSLVLLLAGLTVAGGLLFFAGLLVGVNLGLPGFRQEAAYLPHPAPAMPVKAQPCPEPPSPIAPVVPAQQKPEPAPVPFAPEPEPAPPVQIAEETPAPPQPPQITEEPAPAPAQIPRAVQAALRPRGDRAFSVQVGAFRVKENSDAVVEELKSRGYEPWVETTGSLRIVRVGRYVERGEAQRVASALKSENMEAVVRPVKQL
jgi:cell division septation protein DedD